MIEPEWSDKTEKEHRLRAASAVLILFALVTAVSKVSKKIKIKSTLLNLTAVQPPPPPSNKIDSVSGRAVSSLAAEALDGAQSRTLTFSQTVQTSDV